MKGGSTGQFLTGPLIDIGLVVVILIVIEECCQTWFDPNTNKCTVCRGLIKPREIEVCISFYLKSLRTQQCNNPQNNVYIENDTKCFLQMSVQSKEGSFKVFRSLVSTGF